MSQHMIKPWLASLLNLVPGAGYLYCGRINLAGFVSLVMLGLLAAAILNESKDLLLSYFALMLLLMADGYSMAHRINDRDRDWTRK